MTQDALASMPLPVLSALLCAVISILVRRLDPGSNRTPALLSALFAVFALQAILVALRFGYGVESLALVQRVLPLLVGPLMYLAFSALSVPEDRFRRGVRWHLGAVAFMVAGFQLAPVRLGPLDWVISASYLFYAVALIRLWRQGPDNLIHAHLDMARNVTHWMLWGAGLLSVLLVLDSAIAVSFAMQEGGRALAIISYGSILLILAFLVLAFVLPRLLTTHRARSKAPTEPGFDAARLEIAARDMLTTTRLYLDPDLSVGRLAKRLHVPVRSLSLAINESQGMNVSQYVNGFRLSHATDLLRNGDDSVAKVMAQSGFLTRSNFYREFQRVYGQSPAAYRQGGDADRV